jgi:uncharacterized membrane protein YhaH (DUF805 family)
MFVIRFLFGFRGRINRLQYWGGSFLVGTINAIGVFLTAGSALFSAGLDDKLAATQGAGLLLIPVQIVTMWMTLALQTKRFHDRGRTGWLSVAILVPMVPLFVLIQMGPGDNPAAAAAMMAPFMLLLLAISLWFFVDLGLLPGASGDNAYGSPPTGGMSVGLKGSGAGPVDWDAPVRNPGASLESAEAALERAIAERAARPAGAAAPMPAPAPVAAAPFAMPRPAAPGGFGRRGL